MMLTGDMLRRSAARFPQKPAIICEGAQLSYSVLDARANQFAHALLWAGLTMGDKVAILARNIPDYATVFFGAARSGVILNNLSVLYTADELAYALERTDVEVVIFDEVFAERMADALKMTDRARKAVVIGSTNLLEAETFEKFIADQPVSPPDVVIHADDPFCMTYTGGTTGKPKGIVCSHRARSASAHTAMIEQMIGEQDVVSVVTPLYHIAALHLTFQPAILAGATCVFLPKWSPEGFIEIVRKHDVNVSFMVPTQATRLLSHKDFSPDHLRCWTKANFAGAPMPDSVQKELMDLFPGMMLTQNYGQSEMGMLTVLRHWYLPGKLGSVGRAAINVDLRVVNPDGSDVAAGEIGEVIARGDNMMLEYYREPEQTREFFRAGDGWGWSGDLAKIDGEGFITLVDRSKDMIISGGENIFPKEIEIVLYELEDVGECAVFGIPDEIWGEVPAAYIVRRANGSDNGKGALDEAAVRTWCEGRLARFKLPRLIRFVEDLPKTPIGKIQKTVLREPYWDGRQRRI